MGLRRDAGICYDARLTRCGMKLILLVIISSAFAKPMDCGPEIEGRSRLFEPLAVERRAIYVDRLLRAGFESPRDRVWERTMTIAHPFWISSDPREGAVVEAFARARYFDFAYFPVVVNDHTNFFELLLQVQAHVNRSKGVTLWIAVQPGSRIDGFDAHLFVDGICELMLQRKLVLVIEEESETLFDSELPARFSPAA